MSATEYFDRPPAGWFVLDVMRKESRKWDWVALMVDVDPDHPKDYRPSGRAVHQRWVRIAGKHRNGDAARDALENLIATRH